MAVVFYAYKEGDSLNHAGFLINDYLLAVLVMSKYGDQRLSYLKMGIKILEQKVNPLPVDVGSLQHVHKMRLCAKKIAESANMASHVMPYAQPPLTSDD